MKKVLVAVALVMGLGSSVAFAQNAENANAVVATAQAPQDEYTKIEVKDLPAAVTEALGKAYPESTIKEASVTTKEEGKLYKVVVTQKDGTDVTVVLNEKGEEENRTEDGSIHVHVFSKDTWHRLPWYKKIL